MSFWMQSSQFFAKNTKLMKRVLTTRAVFRRFVSFCMMRLTAQWYRFRTFRSERESQYQRLMILQPRSRRRLSFTDARTMKVWLIPRSKQKLLRLQARNHWCPSLKRINYRMRSKHFLHILDFLDIWLLFLDPFDPFLVLNMLHDPSHLKVLFFLQNPLSLFIEFFLSNRGIKSCFKMGLPRF